MSEGIRAEALKSNRWADLARKALSCALAECSVDSVCVVVGLVFAGKLFTRGCCCYLGGFTTLRGRHTFSLRPC